MTITPATPTLDSTATPVAPTPVPVDPTTVPTDTPDCDPSQDLWGKMRDLGRVEIGNRSATCVYTVGGAIYVIPSGDPDDPDIDSQEWFDDATAAVVPGSRVTLELAIPDCAAVQQDAFWGEPLKSLDGQRYGERLLAADRYHSGICEPTPVPPTATPEPDLPTIIPPTSTTPPTATPVESTQTPIAPTSTPTAPPLVQQPPRQTAVPPTNTPDQPTTIPPTDTPSDPTPPTVPTQPVLPPTAAAPTSTRPTRPETPAHHWPTATATVTTAIVVKPTVIATQAPTSVAPLRVAAEPVDIGGPSSTTTLVPAALPNTSGSTLPIWLGLIGGALALVGGTLLRTRR